MDRAISVGDVHLIHLIHHTSVLQAVPMNVLMDSFDYMLFTIHSLNTRSVRHG